jgi:hypothetical protein
MNDRERRMTRIQLNPYAQTYWQTMSKLDSVTVKVLPAVAPVWRVTSRSIEPIFRTMTGIGIDNDL